MPFRVLSLYARRWQRCHWKTPSLRLGRHSHAGSPSILLNSNTVWRLSIRWRLRDSTAFDSAPGSRHRSDWRDSRCRNCRDFSASRTDRTPGVVDTAHHRGPARDSPAAKPGCAAQGGLKSLTAHCGTAVNVSDFDELDFEPGFVSASMAVLLMAPEPGLAELLKEALDSEGLKLMVAKTAEESHGILKQIFRQTVPLKRPFRCSEITDCISLGSAVFHRAASGRSAGSTGRAA